MLPSTPPHPVTLLQQPRCHAPHPTLSPSCNSHVAKHPTPHTPLPLSPLCPCPRCISPSFSREREDFVLDASLSPSQEREGLRMRIHAFCVPPVRCRPETPPTLSSHTVLPHCPHHSVLTTLSSPRHPPTLSSHTVLTTLSSPRHPPTLSSPLCPHHAILLHGPLPMCAQGRQVPQERVPKVPAAPRRAAAPLAGRPPHRAARGRQL
eukprot:357348-Chlamydomonas_euryale.AAC.3